MPIKLQVVKEGADASDPADYLFEQDVITIGRGSGNDLTLPDQKISKQHAEVRSDGNRYLLVDCDSKNHTFMHGERVGEAEPYVLQSGDVFKVGDFAIEFVPLFMPSSEQTAFAGVSEDGNPFEKHAVQMRRALEGLMETYKFAPSEVRETELRKAIRKEFDPEMGEHDVMQTLMDHLGVSGDGAAGEAPASPDAAPAPDADRPAPEAPPATAGEERDDEAPAEVVFDPLLESIARMISIPTHFWREFSGNTVVHPPEKAFIHRADVQSLRHYLLDAELSEADREERLSHLREAVNTLVAHNVAMLAGYKKAVMAGSKDLLQKVNPIDAVEEVEDGGVLGSLFGGGKKKEADDTELAALYSRWKELFHGEWGKLEKDLFRPTYIEAYLDRMAKAWDVEKSEIVEER